MINTKIAGVSFEGRQDLVRNIKISDVLILSKQPDNKYDKNAIAILDLEGNQLGFIKRELASELAPAMDRGTKYKAKVSAITGKEHNNIEVNIIIYLEGEEGIDTDTKESDEKYNIIPVGGY